jgi:hypothetical protein
MNGIRKINQEEQNKVGRRSKMTEEVIVKLESIFKIGGSIEEACSYAGISDETYRRWMNENNSFMARIESARHYPDIVAKNVVVDSMVKDRDLNTAKWWLEKRQFKEASVQISGEKVLVIPSELLDKYGIAPDNPTRITETSSN